MNFGLFGKMRVKPGQREKVAGIILRDVAQLREIGCILYLVNYSATDPDAIWVTEVWQSEAGHKASLQLPSVQATIKEAMPLLTGEFEQFKLDVVGGLGIDK